MASERAWTLGQEFVVGTGVRVTLYAGPGQRGKPLCFVEAATGPEAITLLLPEIEKLESRS